MGKYEDLAERLYARSNTDAGDRIAEEGAIAIENLLIENRALRQINEKQTAVARMMFDEMEVLRNQLHEANSKMEALRNELCYKCGNYEQAHNGWCDHCRWKSGVQMTASNSQVSKALRDNGFSSIEQLLSAYVQVKSERDGEM